MKSTDFTGSAFGRPQAIPAALTALLSLFMATGVAGAQARPTPRELGGLLVGSLPGTPTDAPRPGPVASGYPDIGELRRKIRDLDIQLYRQWLLRERARYILRYSSNTAELKNYWDAQKNIESLQYQDMVETHTFYHNYLMALQAEANTITNPAAHAQWEQKGNEMRQEYGRIYQTYLTVKGLNQPQFTQWPRVTIHSPETDSGVFPWLSWLHQP